MGKRHKIFILGDGRVGQAILYYLEKNIPYAQAGFLSDDSQAKGCDLLIGALPGELGEKGLSLALRNKINLIDVSDIDPPFYLNAKKKIGKAGITVIPGCGFSPGLVNCILGREFSRNNAVSGVEIKAGSLSKKEFYYPFLWCFEDLILEHKIPSWQVISGKKIKFPAFAGYQEERFLGVAAESYFVASGFENLLDEFRVKNFKCRVIRPAGFMYFFNFLRNHGFLDKENAAVSKQILEQHKENNSTLSEITLETGKEKVVWQVKAFSGKNEPLNSMQKITAAAPAIIAGLILENKLNGQGLLFMEDLGKNRDLFELLLNGIRKENITAKRNIRQE